MLKKIVIGLLVVLVAFALVVAFQPSTFRIERSHTMRAPGYVAFNLVNGLRRWSAWSPWEGRDPSMERSYEGPEAGVGSSYSWNGNDEVGKGRMTITESDPGKRVAIRLEFFEPWQATNTTLFTFEPAPEGVKVSWAMEGANNFFAKAASLFMNMDELIGKDFEQGLEKLQVVAEAEARALEEAKARESAAALKAQTEGAAADAAAP